MADEWKEDFHLKTDIEKYVIQGLMRKEIIDFMKRDFPHYPWSIRSLDRRMRFFEIRYNDRRVAVDQVKEAVKQELQGPGKLLGYRTMHKVIRQKHNLLVTRDAFYDVMTEVDPSGLQARGGIGAKKKKGNFTSKGPNWVHSLDGHDKLMGYQNSTFPLAIYGCIDTASRKILWLRMEVQTISCMIRVDKGTETGIMAAMHAFLRRHHNDGMDPADTVVFGPSTSNQIERWWKELHERMEKYYKEHLSYLKNHGHYDPHDETDRLLLAYMLIPLLQKELDTFKDTIWNTHRIRSQKDTLLPDGVPNHIHSFPEEYGLEECGLPVTEDQLKEAALLSGVLDVEQDFLQPHFRNACERILPNPVQLQPNSLRNSFIHLKQNFPATSSTYSICSNSFANSF